MQILKTPIPPPLLPPHVLYLICASIYREIFGLYSINYTPTFRLIKKGCCAPPPPHPIAAFHALCLRLLARSMLYGEIREISQFGENPRNRKQCSLITYASTQIHTQSRQAYSFVISNFWVPPARLSQNNCTDMCITIISHLFLIYILQ